MYGDKPLPPLGGNLHCFTRFFFGHTSWLFTSQFLKKLEENVSATAKSTGVMDKFEHQ